MKCIPNILRAWLLMSCIGCHASPNIEVAGSYFPAWMLSLVIAVLATVVLHLVARWNGFEDHLEPAVPIYTSITVIITCIIWLAVLA